VDQVLYSSCNAESLALDLAAMPGFSARRARLLDMFPNTDHYELLVLLSRDH
jgi:23S rRNA (uracil747-C5)-methyltransferase